jgi:hypothetical protein
MSKYSELAEKASAFAASTRNINSAISALLSHCAAAIRELEAENERLAQDLSAGGWDQHSKDARIAELEAERDTALVHLRNAVHGPLMKDGLNRDEGGVEFMPDSDFIYGEVLKALRAFEAKPLERVDERSRRQSDGDKG